MNGEPPPVTTRLAAPALRPADDGSQASSRTTLVRYLARSDARLARVVRRIYRAPRKFSLPAPRVVVKPMLWAFVAHRSLYFYLKRVFFSEPLVKACCTRYGKNLRAGEHIPWISGKGDIIVGDDVELDGKMNIAFAARFSDRPTLEFGDGTKIGHDCRFIIGKRITFGRNCVISGALTVYDSNGHTIDPDMRRAGSPPRDEEVRPVVIGDDVWIGRQVMIFPGVRIGDCSVISAGSVVRNHVPPYSVVAGNPARVLFRLKKPTSAAAPAEPGRDGPAAAGPASGEVIDRGLDHQFGDVGARR